MKQITVVADDKVGLLADISYILGKARINIEAIAVEVIGHKAVINLTLKDDKRAAELLKNNGYRVLESEVLVVKLKDEPGELARISERLAEAGINVESLYLLSRHEGYSLDALRVGNYKKAAKLLENCLVKGQ